MKRKRPGEREVLRVPPAYAPPESPELPRFDYEATHPCAADRAAWERRSSPTGEEGPLLFQLVTCKASYVRPWSVPRAARHAIAWRGSDQVPVVRLYGVHASGQSVALNVWNFAPYLYAVAPPTATVCKASDPAAREAAERLRTVLEAELVAEAQEREAQWRARDVDAESVRLPDLDADEKGSNGTLETAWSMGSGRFGDDRGGGSAGLYASEADTAFPAKRRRTERTRDYGPFVIEVVPLMRRLLDTYQADPVLVFRIGLRTPNLVPKVRKLIDESLLPPIEGIGKLAGPTCESGLKYENRFLVDTRIVGSGWVRATGAEARSDVRDTRCGLEYDVDATRVVGVSIDDEPDIYTQRSRWRILSYDIE